MYKRQDHRLYRVLDRIWYDDRIFYAECLCVGSLYLRAAASWLFYVLLLRKRAAIFHRIFPGYFPGKERQSQVLFRYQA